MTKIIGFSLVVAILVYGYFAFNKKEEAVMSETDEVAVEEKLTATEEAEKEETALLEITNGKWVSNEDKQYYIDVQDKSYAEYYGEEWLESGLIKAYDKPADGVFESMLGFLKLEGVGGEKREFVVTVLTETQLEMTLIDGNGQPLNFTLAQ